MGLLRPRDIEILHSANDSPAHALGIEWCKEGDIPPFYLADPELDSTARRAWEFMFGRLSFVARTPKEIWVALWRYAPEVPLDQAPIVSLDLGQFQLDAATFADFLLRLTKDLQGFRSWCSAHGIDTSPTPQRAYAKVRLLPDPQRCFDQLVEPSLTSKPIRKVAPKVLEDLMGMLGTDPRVSGFLTSIESENDPIELRCDEYGRLSTVFLTPNSLRTPVEVRGVRLGDASSVLTRLGRPTKSGEGWRRWDSGDVALHVTVGGAHVSEMTLMLISSLPPILQ